jgi:hypothetical protein
MSESTRKYRVRVRAAIIGEVEVTVYGYNENRRIDNAASEAINKSRRVQIKNARRPITGGDIEVLTVEPIEEIVP